LVKHSGEVIWRKDMIRADNEHIIILAGIAVFLQAPQPLVQHARQNWSAKHVIAAVWHADDFGAGSSCNFRSLVS
jgi:hypothetical protein